VNGNENAQHVKVERAREFGKVGGFFRCVLNNETL
jgi:hypothetical protein